MAFGPRVDNRYDVIGLAYAVRQLRAASHRLGHVPLIEVNPQRDATLNNALEAGRLKLLYTRRRRLAQGEFDNVATASDGCGEDLLASELVADHAETQQHHGIFFRLRHWGGVLGNAEDVVTCGAMGATD